MSSPSSKNRHNTKTTKTFSSAPSGAEFFIFSKNFLDSDEGTIIKDKITYRKVGDHATNQVSSMSFKDGTFFNYTYDEMGNITSVCENGELVARYTYDDLCRLVREDNKRLNKTVVFVYDNNGNILVRREYGFTLVNQETLACTTEVPETFLYIYEGDRLVSFDKQSCIYDDMGCPITYLGKSMTWDAYGKLINFNNGQATYTYDSHGRRVSKTVGNVPTDFIYNKDGNLIYQSSGEDTIWFLYDHTGVMGMKYNDATYFYRKNAQGDVLALLDQDGNVLAKYIYDAWGNHRIVDEDGVDIDENSPYNGIAQANPFRYRSYYFDTETGFYYLPARYYDPAICRFISQDDHSYLDPETINGLNLYAYCLNNPVMCFDPSGHLAFFIVTALIGAVIGVGITAAVDYFADKEFNLHWGWYLGAGIPGAVIGAGIGMAVSYYATGSIAASTGKVFSGLFGKTTLYRSVSVDELADIQNTGRFNFGPRSMDAKQFGLSLDETRKFGNWIGQNNIVSTKIPNRIFYRLDHTAVDTIVFRKGVVTVQKQMLDAFNKSLYYITFM